MYQMPSVVRVSLQLAGLPGSPPQLLHPETHLKLLLSEDAVFHRRQLPPNVTTIQDGHFCEYTLSTEKICWGPVCFLTWPLE